jgi:TPR repeat protein
VRGDFAQALLIGPGEDKGFCSQNPSILYFAVLAGGRTDMKLILLAVSLIGLCSIANLAVAQEDPLEMLPSSDSSPVDLIDSPSVQAFDLPPVQSFATKLFSDDDHGAESLARGVSAANKGDFATALKEWKQLAEAGEAAAQFNISLLYTNGQGVPQDLAHALWWSLPAAEQGFAPAQFKLGYMYLHAQGTAQESVFALTWYTLASSAQTPEGEQAKTRRDKLLASVPARAAELSAKLAEVCRVSHGDCSRALSKLVVPNKSVVRVPKERNPHVIVFGDYPETSIRRQEQAHIDLVYRVAVDGKIEDCAIIDPKSKPVRLVDAACNVVRRWIYSPGMVDGQPVAVPWRVSFNFILRAEFGNRRRSYTEFGIR